MKAPKAIFTIFKTFAVLILVLLVLAMAGCTKSTQDLPAVKQKPGVLPQVKTVEPVASAESVVKEVKTEEIKVEEKTQSNEIPIIPTPKQEIVLMQSDNSYSVTEKTIPAGTTLTWQHAGSPNFVHIVLIDKETTKEQVIRGPRMKQGESWNYTFNEKGAFTVHDLFSGKMRMNVTVT